MYRVVTGEHEDTLVNEPESSYGSAYTYADYVTWKIQERLELFKGRIMKMAEPNRRHQEISMKIVVPLGFYLENQQCKAYHAPFDVRLPLKNQTRDAEITTVVQPDIVVVCDPSKLDERGCCGAPDLVVEILSPGNSKKEVTLKYELYEEAGVKEYWLVHPSEQTVVTYVLDSNGKFSGGRIYAAGGVLQSAAVAGFSMNVEDMFN